MIKLSQMSPGSAGWKKKSKILPKPRSSGVRIIIVEDNELLRAGIRSLISTRREFVLVGEAENKLQAIDLIRRNRPDVVLLSLELRHEDGLEMIPALLVSCETSRIAVLTDSRNPEVYQQAISYGAIGVISKEDRPDSLMSAIRRVHSGEEWYSRFAPAGAIGDLSASNRCRNLTPDEKKIATLTKREREVIRMVGEGMKNGQIGERLFISEITVHHHLTAIYSKLQVKGRLQLIVYAYRNRLAEVPR